MIRGEIGLTVSLQRIRPSLWPTSDIYLGAVTPQDSVTVGCPPPATRQAQDQAETSCEPVAVVEPQVRSHAHRRATDYGKWDAFVDDDSNRMASEPRDDRNASAKVQRVRPTGNVLISAPP